MPASIRFASSLEETASMAVEAAGAKPHGAMSDTDIEAIAEREAAGLLPAQRWIRGYYTGGTVAEDRKSVV